MSRKKRLKKSNRALTFGRPKVFCSIRPDDFQAIDPRKSAEEWWKWLEKYGQEPAPIKAVLNSPRNQV